MAIIDPEGLFGGDRLRRCSNEAQLHWPRLFLASDGFARIEINYARIIGRAYPSFNPAPSQAEVQSWVREYVKNFLIFLYEFDGQLWGQWDTRKEFLPRYKTSSDRRSPPPPDPAYSEWRTSYRINTKEFPKCFGNISETFLHGVGVGVGVGVGKSSIPEGEFISTRTQGSNSDKDSDKTLCAPFGQEFHEWIKPWVRCADPDSACRAWLSSVETREDCDGAFASRDRYLASEQIERGIWMEPAKFLFQQKTSKWAGRWPPGKQAKGEPKLMFK